MGGARFQVRVQPEAARPRLAVAVVVAHVDARVREGGRAGHPGEHLGLGGGRRRGGEPARAGVQREAQARELGAARVGREQVAALRERADEQVPDKLVAEAAGRAGGADRRPRERGERRGVGNPTNLVSGQRACFAHRRRERPLERVRREQLADRADAEGCVKKSSICEQRAARLPT